MKTSKIMMGFLLLACGVLGQTNPFGDDSLPYRPICYLRCPKGQIPNMSCSGCMEFPNLSSERPSFPLPSVSISTICPENWIWSKLLRRCVPDFLKVVLGRPVLGSLRTCPEGWVFVLDTGYCHPDVLLLEGNPSSSTPNVPTDCPEGFIKNPSGEFCLAGTLSIGPETLPSRSGFLDSRDGEDCEEGETWNSLFKQCVASSSKKTNFPTPDTFCAVGWCSDGHVWDCKLNRCVGAGIPDKR